VPQAEAGVHEAKPAGGDDKDPASTGWTEDEAHDFLTAYQEHGLDWQKVHISSVLCIHITPPPFPAQPVRSNVMILSDSPDVDMQIAEQVGSSKTPEDCETLFRQHRGYLTLNVEYHSDVVFATMVHDHFNTVPQKVMTPRHHVSSIATISQLPKRLWVWSPLSASHVWRSPMNRQLRFAGVFSSDDRRRGRGGRQPRQRRQQRAAIRGKGPPHAATGVQGTLHLRLLVTAIAKIAASRHRQYAVVSSAEAYRAGRICCRGFL
jgi:hypothetical protein